MFSATFNVFCCIQDPLNRGANFGIDSSVMSMLPIFHVKPSKDPYRHIDELSQVCKISQIHNILADVMKLCHVALRVRDWFLKLEKEFTSWTEMEKEFLRKTTLHILCPFSLSLLSFILSFFPMPFKRQHYTFHAHFLCLSLSLFIIGTL